MAKGYSVKLPDGMAAAFDEYLVVTKQRAYTFFQNAVERTLTVTSTRIPAVPPKAPKQKLPWWEPAAKIHNMLKAQAIDADALPHNPRLLEQCELIRQHWADIPTSARPKLASWLKAAQEKTPMPRSMALDTFEYGELEVARDDWVAAMPKLTLPTVNESTKADLDDYDPDED